MTREHFNRWYSLRAYYAALTLADLPIQTGCILVYVLITYFMTAQPLEIFRLALFFGILLTTAFVAQSLGLVVGALFNVKVGFILFYTELASIQLYQKHILFIKTHISTYNTTHRSVYGLHSQTHQLFYPSISCRPEMLRPFTTYLGSSAQNSLAKNCAAYRCIVGFYGEGQTSRQSLYHCPVGYRCVLGCAVLYALPPRHILCVWRVDFYE